MTVRKISKCCKPLTFKTKSKSKIEIQKVQSLIFKKVQTNQTTREAAAAVAAFVQTEAFVKK